MKTIDNPTWYNDILEETPTADVMKKLRAAGCDLYRVTGPSAPNGHYSATVVVQDAHRRNDGVNSATGTGPDQNTAIRDAAKNLVDAQGIVIR